MADDAPVVFKRKQSKPSQSSRARPADDSVAAGLEDAATQESGDSPAAVASRFRKQQKARQKQKPQLTFGGDDEVRVLDSSQDSIFTLLLVYGRSRR
jgi:hypothetical protein